MRSLLLASVCSLLSFSPPARAGDCDGDRGIELTISEEIGIGEKAEICLKGPSNGLALFMVSLGDGPTRTAYGDLCLDFPLVFHLIVPLDRKGENCFECGVPCNDRLIGLLFFSQFITCNPLHGRSNGASTLITDGICDGEYCSFTQGGFGQGCHGNNVGCLRDEHFDEVFPNGLVLGDGDGDDDDDAFALVLTSARAVEDFLPAGGQPGALDQDLVDPLNSSAGVLAGQLAAAKLNVGFSAAGFFDGDGQLGDLVYVKCVDDDLIGLSVSEVIDLADVLISGQAGDGLDLDGDGKDDVSFSDLSDALTALNENFHECSGNNGCLDLPR